MYGSASASSHSPFSQSRLSVSAMASLALAWASSNACAYMFSVMEVWECPSTAIELVVVGGESDRHARPLHYDWVLDIREQCLRKMYLSPSARAALTSSKTANCTPFRPKSSAVRPERPESIFRLILIEQTIVGFPSISQYKKRLMEQ